ncbi:MAG: hypothetical protein U0414_44220 [Polyangiaceae bacterium]
MKSHEEMSKAGVVSVWLGDGIHNESEMDAYLAERFSSDFGFRIHPPAGPEYEAGAWSGEKPLEPVASLLDGFSSSARWRDAAVRLAESRGFREARVALVFHAFEYDPSLVRASDAPITFVGAVPFVGR